MLALRRKRQIEEASPSVDASVSRRRVGLLVRTIVGTLVTLLVTSAVTFIAANGTGIDIARKKLGREAAPAQLAAFRLEHGLDQPLVVRYEKWLVSFVQGDWGVSPITDRPVRQDVQPRLVNTAVLAFAALVFALPLSVGLGMFAAKRAGRRSDAFVSTASTVVAAMPEFVVGVLVVLLLGIELHLAPVDSTNISISTSFWPKAYAFVLPTITLILVLMPYLTRMARASTREALSASYVQAATLRGLPRRRVEWGHAMPNAAIPLVNAIAINIVWLLGGTIVIENLFAFPGLGQLLVQAVGAGDTVTVQAIAMVMGTLFVLVSLTADLCVDILNPKLRTVV